MRRTGIPNKCCRASLHLGNSCSCGVSSVPVHYISNVVRTEGISVCSTKRRECFQAMIADALAGKIDLIITKSASRFTRR
ncbi:MAG: hypothetical protein K6G33_02490 [Ruminococcus sp.]|uniref:hypothetical protein n=1 Tax=Ruminococcus sp. TaxID=41978 RepID=UPI0025D719F6|nr:hypothetical protein [Ruminococcus sp.]MCR5599597.1 hypothetical protein [Ruminococcus sp.]